MSQQTAWYDEPLGLNDESGEVAKTNEDENVKESSKEQVKESDKNSDKELAKESNKDISKESKDISKEKKLELSSEDRRLLDEAAARERFSNEIAIAEKNVAGFDRGKVLHKLEEINKKDPATAANLFNAQGLELIWYKYFAHQASSDNIMDSHRARMENFNPTEAIEKINKGEASSADMVDFYSHLGEICR